MDNENKEVEAPRRRGILGRLTLLLGVMIAGVLAMAGSAFATTAPDDGTSQLFTDAQSSITSTLIPAVVALVLAGTLVWMGIAWFKRGKNKASS